MIRRRDFLKMLGAGAVFCTIPRIILSKEDVSNTSEKKPNILFIMSDEHNAGVLGCYGNRIIKTKNLDELSKNGVTFDACYCNSPLCVPSRESFLSGKYISRYGIWSNECELPDDGVASVPRLLNEAGYESFLCGKMHIAEGRNYGFIQIGSFNNHHKTGKGNRIGADDFKPSGKLSGRFDDFHTGNKSSIMQHDSAVTEGAIDFLKKRKTGDKPFFLTVGYLAPHFPLIVPEKYWDEYKDKVQMPNIPPGHLDSLPLNYKHLRNGFQVENVPDDIVKKGRELYYGLTQWMDEQVGQVFGALKESGFAENTIVIYTTDHGENMGEHGLWWKNCLFDTTARVPLIVNWPKKWKGSSRRTGACSLVDVASTIVDMGGGKAPADWDGMSMLQWLDKPDALWKDMAITEYYAHHISSGYVMIRKGKFKYVYHTPPDSSHPAERELYDLEKDPGELKNLAKDSAFDSKIAEMHDLLLKELRESPDDTEKRCRANYAKGYSETVGGGKGKKEKKKDRKGK